MTSFNECIQKRIDITAYSPDSQQEADEFLSILDHNHRVIHQCSREAGFRIQSDPHYNGAIEAELWDSLNVLRGGKAYAKLAPADQEKLVERLEETVRYADHMSDDSITSLVDIAGGVVVMFTVFPLMEGFAAKLPWILGVGALASGVVGVTVLAGVYLHYRK